MQDWGNQGATVSGFDGMLSEVFLRYTRGEMTRGETRQLSHALLYLKDEGITITSDARQRAFAAFTRGDTSFAEMSRTCASLQLVQELL